MKAIIAILLAVVMTLGVIGCASTDAGSQVTNGDPGKPSPEATAPSKVGGDTGEPSPEATAPSKAGGDTGEPSPEATHTGTAAETTGFISEERAWHIALEHAGLKADQVTGTRVELDQDDGVPEYEVEFFLGTVEYDYDIDATTGQIRSFDRGE